MSKLRAILFNRVSLHVLLLLIGSALLWLAMGYIKFGDQNVSLGTISKILVIAFFWSIWIVSVLLQTLYKAKPNAEHDKKSRADADSPSIIEAKKSSSDYNSIKKSFEEAVQALKNSNLRLKRSKLYELPWYALIGPSGSGKTSFLKNSGLEFPLNGKQHQEHEGISGTKNCEWWFNNDAVLIDTPGRYTTQDSNRESDNDSWLAFTSLLKTYRKRRPLNGAIVVISAQDLLFQNDSQKQILSDAIRHRIDELNKTLEAQIPVYLVINKLDLLAGFKEFYEPLSGADRIKALGCSFDNKEIQDPGIVRDKLGKLLLDTENKTIDYLRGERSPDKRIELNKFPSQLEQLLIEIEKFCTRTFNDNRYQSNTFLRGVHLCSAAQKETPIDKILVSISSQFKLPRPKLSSAENSNSSFFVKGLLKNFIFQQSDLAGLNYNHEKNLIWTRRSLIAIAFVAFIALTAGWTKSLLHNNDLMNRAQQESIALTELLSKFDPTSSGLDELAAILLKAEEIKAVYDDESTSWGKHFGLYNDSPQTKANAIYQAALTNPLLSSLRHFSEETIQDRLKAKDKLGLFSDLKIYLTMEDKTKRNQEEFINYFAERLQGQYPELKDSLSIISRNIEALVSVSGWQIATNEKLVAAARKSLKQQSHASMVYQVFLANMTQHKPTLLSDSLPPESLRLFSIEEKSSKDRIPYQFTRAAYLASDFGPNSDLLTDFQSNAWVLGQNSETVRLESELLETGKLAKQMYVRDYKGFWINRAENISIRKMTSLDEISIETALLSKPADSAINQLAELIVKHTKLTPDISGVSEKNSIANAAAELISEKVTPTEIDLTFKSLHKWAGTIEKRSRSFSRLQAALSELDTYVTTIALAPSPSKEAFGFTKTRFSTGGRDVFHNLKAAAKESPDFISHWIKDLALQAWSHTVSIAYQHANAEYKNQVCSQFNTSLAPHFPFSNASEDADAADFHAFFGSDGIEAGFVSNYIAPFSNLASYTLKSVEGISFKISQKTLSMIKRAAAIREAMYSLDSDAASLELSFTPQKLDRSVRSFSYQVSEKQPKITYSHGPKLPTTIKWRAGQDALNLAKFVDVNSTERTKTYKGDWSFLRGIYDSNPQSGDRPNEMVLTFVVEGREARYSVSAKAPIEAIKYNSFLKYKCSGNL